MKIGIVGTGNMGRILGCGWAVAASRVALRVCSAAATCSFSLAASARFGPTSTNQPKSA